jgi:hypothetical protein
LRIYKNIIIVKKGDEIEREIGPGPDESIFSL